MLDDVYSTLSDRLKDDDLGFVLKGYGLIPNPALQNLIGVYTPEVIQEILEENPEIVERWLRKLDREYHKEKEMCEDNDSAACFNLPFYEEFERQFKSWQNGGMVTIRLPGKKSISLSRKPLFSVARKPLQHVCERCLASFEEISKLEEHYERVHNPAKDNLRYVIEKPDFPDKELQDPVWW